MREVHIYRADGLDVEPVLISIKRPLPLGGTLADHSIRAVVQADALAEAIWSSCPGSTVDALLAALLTRKASLLRVTHPQEKKS